MVVDLVLLDFSKAFDVVSHVVLLEKLRDLSWYYVIELDQEISF